MHRVLLIDNEKGEFNSLSGFLKDYGYHIDAISSGEISGTDIHAHPYHILLCDSEAQNMDNGNWIQNIKEAHPHIVLVFLPEGLTGADKNREGKSTREGYQQSLLFDEILGALNRATQTTDTGACVIHNEENCIFKNNTDTVPFHEDQYVTGICEVSKVFLEHAGLVAPTDYSIIIQGETGTGKEALARFIHHKSKRRKGPFMTIDCGSLSMEWAAIKLFGQEARHFPPQCGIFEQASGGTLFLDEIGDLPLELQAGLQRTIEEKHIRKVGAIKDNKLDVRIIVASNKSLSHSVENDTFRKDLYHRLNEFQIKVPPLRERAADIELFIQFFIKNACRELGKKTAVCPAHILRLLKAYHWPGNIRELKNVIRRACLLTPEGGDITEAVLPAELIRTTNTKPAYADVINKDADASTLKNAAAMEEQKIIMEVLRRVKFNKTKAAAILNIDRKTLYNKLKSIK